MYFTVTSLKDSTKKQTFPSLGEMNYRAGTGGIVLILARSIAETNMWADLALTMPTGDVQLQIFQEDGTLFRAFNSKFDNFRSQETLPNEFGEKLIDERFFFGYLVPLN